MKVFPAVLCLIAMVCILTFVGCTDAQAGECDTGLCPIQKCPIQKACPTPTQKADVAVDAPGVRIRVGRLHCPRVDVQPLRAYAPVRLRQPTVLEVPPGSIMVNERAGLFGWHRAWRVHAPVVGGCCR